MELKPCPFCGGEIRIVRLHGSYGEPWYARCDHCEVSSYYYKTEAQAIEAWSDRPERTCERSRYAELFGTPERAARTLYYDKEPTCAGCALMGECEKTPDEEHDTCFLIDYDALLEWLRGDAE